MERSYPAKNKHLEEASQARRPGLNNRLLILIFTTLLLIGAVVFAFLHQNQEMPTANNPAPEFSVTTLDGGVFDLADYRGQIVVMNVWGSWCGPCRAEASLLEALHQQYAEENVVFIGISHPADEMADVRAFIEEFNITYPNALDSQKTVTKNYHVKGVPQTFIIDQQGDIAEDGFFPAPITQAETLTTVINRLLNTDTNPA